VDRTFKNPSNNHMEMVPALAWLWMLLFGAIYLAVKGLWGHFAIWILIIFGLGVITAGPGAMVAMPILSIGYAFAIQGILTGSYLRKGWVEVAPNATSAYPMRAVDTSPDRSCPYCAELIKKAAVRCKHCGSEVEAVNQQELPQPPALTHGWTVRFGCEPWAYAETVTKARALGLPILKGEPTKVVTGPYASEQEAKTIVNSCKKMQGLDGYPYWMPKSS
jgi:hypothetical protein